MTIAEFFLAISGLLTCVRSTNPSGCLSPLSGDHVTVLITVLVDLRKYRSNLS